MDQVRGEYLLVGNGGHADYPGNEGYALSLRVEQPTWRRLSDPTPNSQLGDFTLEGDGTYLDGRPRAMHSTFETFGDGRVWFPLQNSVSSGGGGSVNGIVAYNRDGLGAATSPLAWTSANLGPWERFGRPYPAGAYIGSVIFGVAVFDRVAHKVWALGGNSANSTMYWSVDTAGPSLGSATTYQANRSFGHWGGWAVIATDLRIIVAGDHLRQTITVLDIENPGAPNAWTQVTNVSGAGRFDQGSGGVYVAANHSIGVGNPKTHAGSIAKLVIPTRVMGSARVYDPSGQWTWTTLPATGATLTAPPGNSDTYSKWNLIEDMGSGQSALVVVTDITGPTYVYKIPRAGL